MSGWRYEEYRIEIEGELDFENTPQCGLATDSTGTAFRLIAEMGLPLYKLHLERDILSAHAML